METLRARIAAAGGTAPHFHGAHGTVSGAPSVDHSTTSPRSAEVARWLASDDAREFDGRWVVLDSALRVVDSNFSARALKELYPDAENFVVVFVLPPRVRFG